MDFSKVPRRGRRDGRISLYEGKFRFGYFQYKPDFRDNWFRFRRYCFSPLYAPCVASPWYFYPQLPPYIISTEVIYVNPAPDDTYAYTYQWYPTTEEDIARSALDQAIDDIVGAFQEGDETRMDHLVPRDGNVAIYLDNQYRYSVQSGDFEDMMVDAVDNVQTESYEIVSARIFANRDASVEARHNTIDPWGRRSSVYHTYRLVSEPDGYVIREFGTSQSRSF